ncbi:MAG: protein kinase, partial [Acidobacteria bacterium]|nr:protein kinase [Acidobacteriota bacterium]
MLNYLQARQTVIRAVSACSLDLSVESVPLQASLARVHREAQAMGRLGDHPHIVTIHDIGDENGQPYIVCQYMAGGDREVLLQRAETR